MPVYLRRGKWEIRCQIRGVKYYEQVPEARSRTQAKVAEADLVKRVYEGRYGKEGHEVGSADFVRFCRETYVPYIRGHLKRPKNQEYKVGTLCRYFRGKRLKDITLIEIEKFRRSRVGAESRHGRPRKACTVREEVVTLSAILNLAVENDLLGLNPCRKLKWRQGETVSRRERVLSREEEAQLLPHLRRFPETLAAVVLALNTGQRRMSILNLKDTDVDFPARTCRFTGKRGKEATLPLNDEALAILRTLYERRTGAGHLFHHRKGHNLSASDGAFQLSVRRAGLSDLHFHDLRHTFSTRLRRVTDAFTVRDVMGHSRVDTTDIYVTASAEEMREAICALNRTADVLPFRAKTG